MELPMSIKQLLYNEFSVMRMREIHSRTPSPVPSTGMESSLFKEAHMQIDIMSSQHPSSGIVILQ